jgi:hypothetical protein
LPPPFNKEDVLAAVPAERETLGERPEKQFAAHKHGSTV